MRTAEKYIIFLIHWSSETFFPIEWNPKTLGQRWHFNYRYQKEPISIDAHSRQYNLLDMSRQFYKSNI